MRFKHIIYAFRILRTKKPIAFQRVRQLIYDEPKTPIRRSNIYIDNAYRIPH